MVAALMALLRLPRPCNSNNGNLCEPYEFALHGEGRQGGETASGMTCFGVWLRTSPVTVEI